MVKGMRGAASKAGGKDIDRRYGSDSPLSNDNISLENKNPLNSYEFSGFFLESTLFMSVW